MAAGLDGPEPHALEALDALDIDPAIRDIFARFRSIVHQEYLSRLTNAELDDLACFAVRQAAASASAASRQLHSISDVRRPSRLGLALYLLILHGTTYYSHADLANTIEYSSSDLTSRLWPTRALLRVPYGSGFSPSP